MELANKTVIVVGLGVTGIAVARFLKKRGAVVIATDQATEGTLGPGPRKSMKWALPWSWAVTDPKPSQKQILLL